MMTSRVLLALMVMTLTLGGCRKKPAPAPTPEPAPTQAATPTAPAAPAADRDAEARAAAERRTRARTILEERVHFDYDDAGIRSDAKAILDAKLPILRDNSDLRIRIEGHCDERGSNEYNIALGSRRAESIRRYLIDAGISPSRFEVVSYGEERPLSTGSSEGAWSQNRRGEFRILSGLGG